MLTGGKCALQLNGAHAALQPGAYSSAPVVQPAAGGSDALWVPVEEGAGVELAVENAVVEAVRRLLPSLAIDVRADLQARSPPPVRPGHSSLPPCSCMSELCATLETCHLYHGGPAQVATERQQIERSTLSIRDTEHVNKSMRSSAWKPWAEEAPVSQLSCVRQVLTPMRKGAAGVAQLNARLQALLNPPAPGRTELSLGSGNGVVLRVGDRVIQVMFRSLFRLPMGC